MSTPANTQPPCFTPTTTCPLPPSVKRPSLPFSALPLMADHMSSQYPMFNNALLQQQQQQQQQQHHHQQQQQQQQQQQGQGQGQQLQEPHPNTSWQSAIDQARAWQMQQMQQRFRPPQSNEMNPANPAQVRSLSFIVIVPDRNKFTQHSAAATPTPAQYARAATTATAAVSVRRHEQ